MFSYRTAGDGVTMEEVIQKETMSNGKATTSEWCYSTKSVIVVDMLPPQSGAILLNL